MSNRWLLSTAKTENKSKNVLHFSPTKNINKFHNFIAFCYCSYVNWIEFFFLHLWQFLWPKKHNTATATITTTNHKISNDSLSLHSSFHSHANEKHKNYHSHTFIVNGRPEKQVAEKKKPNKKYGEDAI